MKKSWTILALLIGALVLAAGAAGGVSPKNIFAVNWQTNLDVAPQGILFGLRDKNGDMPVNYTVVFQVQTPGGGHYQVTRQVRAHDDNFLEVVFPRDFNAPAGVLASGPYLGKYLVSGKPVIMEKFNFRQGRIQNRKTWWGATKKWVNLY